MPEQSGQNPGSSCLLTTCTANARRNFLVRDPSSMSKSTSSSKSAMMATFFEALQFLENVRGFSWIPSPSKNLLLFEPHFRSHKARIRKKNHGAPFSSGIFRTIRNGLTPKTGFFIHPPSIGPPIHPPSIRGPIGAQFGTRSKDLRESWRRFDQWMSRTFCDYWLQRLAVALRKGNALVVSRALSAAQACNR